MSVIPVYVNKNTSREEIIRIRTVLNRVTNNTHTILIINNLDVHDFAESRLYGSVDLVDKDIFYVHEQVTFMTIKHGKPDYFNNVVGMYIDKCGGYFNVIKYLHFNELKKLVGKPVLIIEVWLALQSEKVIILYDYLTENLPDYFVLINKSLEDKSISFVKQDTTEIKIKIPELCSLIY